MSHAATKVEAAKPFSPAKRWWDGILAFATTQVVQARKAPVTIALVVILWVVGAVTGSLLDGPSESLLDTVGAGVPAFQDGHWWTPLTAAFFAADLFTYLGVTVLLLVARQPVRAPVGQREDGLDDAAGADRRGGRGRRSGRAVRRVVRLAVGRLPGLRPRRSAPRR